MPVDSRHPEYDANAAKWQRCHDAADGEDAVKARGEAYLPKPSGLDSREYAAYVERALYYEAVGKTVDSFVGAISRKPHRIEVPAIMQPILDDADANGIALDDLIKSMCGEVLLMGRGGLLVDYDEKLARCYFSVYQTEAITNWSSDRIVLFETVYEADPQDTFKQIAIEQYRELSIADGVYTVTIWRKQNNEHGIAAEWGIYGAPIIPTKRGAAFDAIPFVWLTPIGNTPRVVKPPLLGLVNLSLSHYRNSADLQHGAHFTGLPTLYATGISDQDGPIRVGASAIIMLQDPNSKVGYAEFTGQGLGALEKLIAAIEGRMAAVGAAILGAEASKRNETATAAELRHVGETSLLSAAVSAVQAGLKVALAIAADWQGANGKIAVELNTDFVSKRMDDATLTGLVQAFQAGALELSTFLNALADGEIIPQVEANNVA